LRTIELALDVKIAHRHEQFKIDGHKAKATRAMEILQALYERAARPISPEMVQLMLASDASMDADGGVLLQTRRSDLRARTPNQETYLANIGSSVCSGRFRAQCGATHHPHAARR
jgi:phosphate starvation-inducible PhoH-like protein